VTGGADVGSGLGAGGGLVADVQATTRRPTTIVVATRESEERIRRPLAGTFAGERSVVPTMSWVSG